MVVAAEAEAQQVPSLFSLPPVQALLGGEARARQLLQHFQQPLLWDPSDPRANWEFATFVLSVVVGLRASGVFASAYPECGQVRCSAARTHTHNARTHTHAYARTRVRPLARPTDSPRRQREHARAPTASVKNVTDDYRPSASLVCLSVRSARAAR